MRHLHHRLRRERPLAHDPILEGAARQVLHGYVVHPVFSLAPVEDGDYVRVGERRGVSGFPSEALDELPVLGVVVLQQLEGHVPIEDLVVGQVDIRHASAAHQASELVSLVDESLPHKANHTRRGFTPSVGCEVLNNFPTYFRLPVRSQFKG
jgi:hypothetical protein